MYILKIEQNDGYPKFQAIKLSPKEFSKSEELLYSLRVKNLTVTETSALQSRLFNIFSNHLKKEAYLKSRHVLIEKDVFSELSMLFINLIKNVSDNFSLQNLIEELNRFKPSKETMPLASYHRSLDENAYRDNEKIKRLDLLTEDNLIAPESEIEIEKKKNELKKSIKDANLSAKVTKRMNKYAKGEGYHKIASGQHVSDAAIWISLQRGILKMQADNNCIPIEIINKAKAIAYSLHCSEQDVIKAGIRKPNILYYTPEKLKQNAEELAKLLSCSEQEIIKAGLQQANILCQTPKKLKQNVEKLAKLLECSEQDIVRVGLKKPNILYQNPETLNQNVEKLTKLLGCNKKDVIKAGLRFANILYQNPEKLKHNAEELANLLGCSEQEIIKAGLKEPPLLYQNPEKLKHNVEKLAKLLECSEEDIVKAGLRKGCILCQKPETLAHKVKLTRYYNKIQKKSHLFTIYKVSDKQLYTDIMRVILQKTDPSNDNYKLSNFNFEKFIRENSEKILDFEIPEDEVAQDLIDYAQNASIKILNKNIFRFTVKDS